MRIDGFSSQSYPLKRTPRKSKVQVDESVEDADIEFENPPPQPQRSASSGERISQLPARQQDMIFQRAMSKRVASALYSYLTTAGFVESEIEVLGLDLYI